MPSLRISGPRYAQVIFIGLAPKCDRFSSGVISELMAT